MCTFVQIIIVIGVSLFIINNKKPEWVTYIKNKILGE
jgi:hypothetical protein